ncbi:hypothetical protein E1A91_A06G108800v1 [Gossypium mustelinum]|uniref:Uncharacterized protein n=1 Tax=Gossypium mustelinum TaxID=34275 RepID=A0A5D2YUA3_GOSMU|nr:hypothetical protein E1A91_A06G108800v1 [Gossypium mustelinum]
MDRVFQASKLDYLIWKLQARGSSATSHTITIHCLLLLCFELFYGM